MHMHPARVLLHDSCYLAQHYFYFSWRWTIEPDRHHTSYQGQMLAFLKQTNREEGECVWAIRVVPLLTECNHKMFLLQISKCDTEPWKDIYSLESTNRLKRVLCIKKNTSSYSYYDGYWGEKGENFNNWSRCIFDLITSDGKFQMKMLRNKTCDTPRPFENT